MRAPDQRIAEKIVRAVAAGGVTVGTVQLAKRLVERWDREPAPRPPAPEKKAIASVRHHAKARRAEELADEEVRADVWDAVLVRATIDHRGRCACEACHRPRTLEPHHLEPGRGNRVDRIDRVMALCRGCHTGDGDSAHRRPRDFAQTVVVPWARAHRYELPNRKEYRDV
jgi:hypothetical protein